MSCKKLFALFLVFFALGAEAQQTPQAIPLSSGACKLDGTSGCGGGSGTLANIPSATPMAGSLLATAITAPSTPASGKGSVYVDSMSKNIAVKDDAGTVKHGVQTKAAVSNSYVTAIDDAGAVTVAQPASTNLSDSSSLVRTSDKLSALSATTSAELAGVLSDETGSGGGFVRATSPTLTTPNIGVATATSITGAVGTTLSVTATAPAQITTAQAGTPLSVTASGAVAGSSVAGAAAGGGITLTTGAAARLTSGNANGGDASFNLGAGIGTGRRGTVSAPGAGANSEGFGLANVADGARATAIGNAANCSTFTDVVAVGYNTAISGNDNVAIGSGASGGNTAGVGKNVAIGKGSNAGAAYTIAIGETAGSTSQSGIVIGQGSYSVSGSNGPIVIGSGGSNTFNSNGSIVIGSVSAASGTHQDIVIGGGVSATASNQLLLGGTTTAITTAYVGKGVTSSSAAGVTFGTTGGSGSNNAGGALTLLPGLSTGNAAGAPFTISTGYPIASGSTAQTASLRYYAPSTRTTLTESTDTAIATLTFGASSVIGARFLVTVQANDATDYQAITYAVTVNSVRKATGNTVSSVGSVADATAAASSGTLSCTFTVTEGASAATLNANCTSSLTQTTLNATWQSLSNGGGLTLAQN